MNGFLAKIRKAQNSMQWQITKIGVLAALIVCLLILALRYIGLSLVMFSANNNSLMINSIFEMLDSPDFRKDFERQRRSGEVPFPDEEQKESERSKQRPENRNFWIIDFLLDNAHIDFRYLPINRITILYISNEGVMSPINLGMNDQANEPEELDKTQTEIVMKKANEIFNRFKGFTEMSTTTVTEGSSAYGITPFRDRSGQENGYFFIYMPNPSQSEIASAVFLSSLPSFLLLILFAASIGVIIGHIYAKRWVIWMNDVSSATRKWSEGDFSARIQADSSSGYAEWEEMTENLNELSVQLDQVVHTRQELAALEERNKLARELHDSVKQQIFSVSMNLGAAQALMTKNSPKAAEKVEISAKLTQDTLLELDALINTLRPAAKIRQSSRISLEKYLKQWEKSAGIQLDYTISDSLSMNEATFAAVYRICQEGLSNIVRHSGAKKAELALSETDLGLTLTIRDNGKGFDSGKEHSGMGIRSIRERVDELNGSFNIKTGENGTALHIYIPRQLSLEN